MLKVCYNRKVVKNRTVKETQNDSDKFRKPLENAHGVYLPRADKFRILKYHLAFHAHQVYSRLDWLRLAVQLPLQLRADTYSAADTRRLRAREH